MKLPSLKTIVNWLENSIITLSGPAIAISGIIAGIDLLTGGSMLKDVSWLSLTWAVCLLLTLDFQVLMLGARAKRIYLGNKGGWRKFSEILVTFLIAASISYVSVQMQSIIARSQTSIMTTDKSGHQITHTISIDQATRDMGINPVALIWERSSLVLILIFMSGWLRDEEKLEPADRSQSQTSPINYEELAKQVVPLLTPTLDTFKATLVEELKTLASAPVIDYQQIAKIVVPLVAPEPVPQINYQEVARNIAPLLRPTFTEVHRTIIEEVKAIMPQLAPVTVVPAPQIGATSRKEVDAKHGSGATSTMESGTGDETDAQREARLEVAYQDLVTEGKRVSGRSLAERAHANRKAATDWLRENYPDGTGLGATTRSQSINSAARTTDTTEPVFDITPHQEGLVPEPQGPSTKSTFESQVQPHLSGASATFPNRLEPLITGTGSTGTTQLDPLADEARDWSHNGHTDELPVVELVSVGATVSN